MISTLIFLPSLLLIIPSLITFPTTKAVDYFSNCGGSLTYNQNSSYQTNLLNLLPTLSTQALKSGFYNTSLGRFPNRVYALYLCRPDVGSRGCNQCVYQAQTKILQQCPTQVWAVIWCDECMLLFNNTPLYRTMQVSPRAVSWNPVNVSQSLAPLFSQAVNDTMAGLVTRVGNDSGRFGTEEANVPGSELYALAQCTPDLSQGECDTCLRVAMGQLPIMPSGGRVLQPSCNMRFELDNNFYGDYFNYTFLLSATNTTIATPTSVSATNTVTITTPTSVSATNYTTSLTITTTTLASVSATNTTTTPTSVSETNYPTTTPNTVSVSATNTTTTPTSVNYTTPTLNYTAPTATVNITSPTPGSATNHTITTPTWVSATNTTTTTSERKGQREKKKGSSHIALVVALPLILAVLFLCSVCFCYRYRKSRESSPEELEEITRFTTAESLQFDFRAVRAATNNFSLNNKLGEGGFGGVYKGRLPNGQEIAVKRLSANSGQGSREFKTEVLLVARLQHKNLVRLLGFCLRKDEKLLVYELLPNSSLDKVLLDRSKDLSVDWETRYKIIAGIARGLLYLHEDSRLKIIHRDLKSSNILLDESMNPKISDFGLAKLVGTDQIQADTNRIVGTYGYMAPEYAMTGRFSFKSDVYSFGIIVLEIVGGHKCNSTAFPYHEESLIQRAWRLWNDDKALEMVDPRLGGNFSSNEVSKCIHIGLLCIQEATNRRPTMVPIVSALNGHPVDLPAPSPPQLASTGHVSPQTSSAFSGNKDSITELYPR